MVDTFQKKCKETLSSLALFDRVKIELGVHKFSWMSTSTHIILKGFQMKKIKKFQRVIGKNFHLDTLTLSFSNSG